MNPQSLSPSCLPQFGFFPWRERRLFVVVHGTHEHLYWDEKEALAGKPDFP